MPQKRRRTYIVAFQKDSKISKKFSSPEKWIYESGVFAKAFPLAQPQVGQKIGGIALSLEKENRLVDISINFNGKRGNSPFEKAGVMVSLIQLTIHLYMMDIVQLLVSVL